MLTKYIVPGQKVDLQAVDKSILRETKEKRVYHSQVYDVISDERLEILMPMEQSKLILLPLDAEYEIFFYTKEGLYECAVRVIDRYKSNNLYILLCELTSNLRKYQRREFFRFSCILNMVCRELDDEEIKALENREQLLKEGQPLQKGTVVDISGGGARFVSNFCYSKGTYIYLSYNLIINGREKSKELMGRVLHTQEIENRKGEYEHRIQYIHISRQEREEIIQYIFEEERKNRQRMKG